MSTSSFLKSHLKPASLMLLALLQLTACGSGSTNSVNSLSNENGITNSNETSDTAHNDTVVSTSDNITLNWAAPTEREDNQAISLADIAGYKIYYGNTQNNYNNSIHVNDGTAENYTFKELPAGTYYFVITTLDVDNRESEFSPEVSGVIS